MKAKHIITAVLLVIIPFVFIIGFGELGRYFFQLAGRYYTPVYSIFGMLAYAIPETAYIIWISFVIRTKYRSARILFSCCCFAVAAVILGCYLSIFCAFSFYKYMFTITALVCILANLFAVIYMLCKGRKGNIIADKRIHE